MGSRIRRMSAKMIAASTPKRSAAVTVTSAAREGVLHNSRKVVRARTSRYSLMYLPACRINQIGVKGTDSRRHARMNGLLRRDSVNRGFAVTLKLDTSALTSI